MTIKLPGALLATGVALLMTSGAAQALCIETLGATPPNDIAFTGCGATGVGTVCDMNGVQDGWTTHGAVSIVGNERIFSWTRNTIEVTEEYTCRINTVTGASSGAVHIFSGIAGAPKGYVTFQCRLVQACG